jgi:hypothetical protein
VIAEKRVGVAVNDKNAPSTVAIDNGACSIREWPRLDRSGGGFPVPGVGFAAMISLYFAALGSGALSISCAGCGPVCLGIPVINPW